MLLLGIQVISDIYQRDAIFMLDTMVDGLEGSDLTEVMLSIKNCGVEQNVLRSIC